MTNIVLTEEQVKILSQAVAPVRICHPQGIVLGTVDPELTPEFIAEMKRCARSPGPWYTSAQMQRHLQGLEEAWEREGPFDKARMLELLDQIRAADPK